MLLERAPTANAEESKRSDFDPSRLWCDVDWVLVRLPFGRGSLRSPFVAVNMGLSSSEFLRPPSTRVARDKRLGRGVSLVRSMLADVVVVAGNAIALFAGCGFANAPLMVATRRKGAKQHQGRLAFSLRLVDQKRLGQRLRLS